VFHYQEEDELHLHRRRRRHGEHHQNHRQQLLKFEQELMDKNLAL
jgi:hypothetical protein